MSYNRVLPRDLFNEAKLLKCLGFITLHIHDGILRNLEFEFEGDAFEIDFRDGLEVINLVFNLGGDLEYREISFTSPYNSKRNFPLEFVIDDCYEPVFNEDGTYTTEFLNLLATGEIN